MMLIRPRARRIIVPHDDTGRPVGYLTEHWDDHVDARVVAPESTTVRIQIPKAEHDRLRGFLRDINAYQQANKER